MGKPKTTPLDTGAATPRTKRSTPKVDPTASQKPAARTAIDWESIELDYRAGLIPLRQIGEKHGVTHGAINKRAKKENWERDLSAKIQKKADALVSKAAVSTTVSTETKVAENEVINANALAIANVRLSHRSDIQKTRGITMALLEELERQTGAENVALLEQLGVIMRQEDEYGRDKLNDLYHKIISLAGRSSTMKSLSESLKVLVALERQAFGLDEKDGAPVDALTSLLHGIAGRSTNGFRPVAVDPEHQAELDDE